MCFSMPPKGDGLKISAQISIPTSTNKLHSPGAGGGVYRSTDYAKWRKAAGWELAAYRPKWPKLGLAADTPYALALALPHIGDIDNRIKALLDLLREMRVTPDDFENAFLMVGISPELGPMSCAFSVWSLDLDETPYIEI